jgi:hypothetical protein
MRLGVASRLPSTKDMRFRSRALIGVLAVAALSVGCATTRAGSMGPLPNNESLVTLIVTKDRSIIEDECRGAPAPGPVLGCQVTRVTTLPDGQEIRLIKIIRYTDRTPSAMAFEIDLHELCHTVATLQPMSDPCHVGNDGFLKAATPRAATLR